MGRALAPPVLHPRDPTRGSLKGTARARPYRAAAAARPRIAGRRASRTESSVVAADTPANRPLNEHDDRAHEAGKRNHVGDERRRAQPESRSRRALRAALAPRDEPRAQRWRRQPARRASTRKEMGAGGFVDVERRHPGKYPLLQVCGSGQETLRRRRPIDQASAQTHVDLHAPVRNVEQHRRQEQQRARNAEVPHPPQRRDRLAEHDSIEHERERRDREEHGAVSAGQGLEREERRRPAEARSITAVEVPRAATPSQTGSTASCRDTPGRCGQSARARTRKPARTRWQRERRGRGGGQARTRRRRTARIPSSATRLTASTGLPVSHRMGAAKIALPI